MAFNPLSVTTFIFKDGIVPLSFAKTEIQMKMDTAETSNFNSAAKTRVTGLYDCEIDSEGPYDQGNYSTLALGSTFSPVITYTTGITLTPPVILDKIGYTADVSSPSQRIKMHMISTGTFTLTVL